MIDLSEMTQADRIAAAAVMIKRGRKLLAKKIADGEADLHHMPQAFAAHRIAHQPKVGADVQALVDDARYCQEHGVFAAAKAGKAVAHRTLADALTTLSARLEAQNECLADSLEVRKEQLDQITALSAEVARLKVKFEQAATLGMEYSKDAHTLRADLAEAVGLMQAIADGTERINAIHAFLAKHKEQSQ